MKLILLFWPYFLVCFGTFHACLGCVCTGCAMVSKDCRHGCTCPGPDGAVLTLELEINSPLLDPLAVSERCWSVELIGPLWSLAYLQAWWIGYKVVPSLVLRFIFTAWFLLPAAAVDWSWKDRRDMGLGSHPGLPCRSPLVRTQHVWKKEQVPVEVHPEKFFVSLLPSWELRNVLQNQSHYPLLFAQKYK